MYFCLVAAMRQYGPPMHGVVASLMLGAWGTMTLCEKLGSDTSCDSESLCSSVSTFQVE